MAANYDKAFVNQMNMQALGNNVMYDQRYDMIYNNSTPVQDTIPSVLIIDSKYRDDASTTSPNDYIVTLISKYPDTVSFELVHCNVPNSNYNVITGVNDLIHFNDGAGDRIATLLPGLYTLSTIGTAVAVALNAAPDTAITSFSSLIPAGATDLLTIITSPTEPFTIQTGTNSVYRTQTATKTLGFRPTDVVSTVVGGNYAVNSHFPPPLELDSYISLHIDGMERCDSNSNSIQNCFCVLPLNSAGEAFGLLKDPNNVDNDNYKYFYVQPKKLSKLRISFRDWNDNLYDFMGREHILVFKVNTLTHKKKFNLEDRTKHRRRHKHH